MKLKNLLIEVWLSMEKAQFSKSICNNQLKQSLYLCDKRNMFKIWQAKNFCRAKVKGHMTLHTYPPQPVTHPRINILHLTVSEICPRQDFKVQGNHSKVKGQIKVTSMMLYTYTPNQCPYKVSTS